MGEFYNKEHKDYQRETWAGFNVLLFMAVGVTLFLAVVTFIWSGLDMWLLFTKIMGTVLAMAVLSLVFYCIVYKPVVFAD